MLLQLLAITMASTFVDAQQLYNPNVEYTMNLPATAGIFKGLSGFSVDCSGSTPSSCALTASWNSSATTVPFIWADAVISKMALKGSYSTSSSPGPGVTVHSFNSALGINYTGPAGDGDTIAQIDTGGKWAVSSYGIQPDEYGTGDEVLTIASADLTYGLMVDGSNPTMADVKFTDIPTVLNGAINPFYSCSSEFQVSGDAIVGVGGGNSGCTFTVPDNSSFLFINGTQGPSYGGVSVNYPSWDTMGGASNMTNTMPNHHLPTATLYSQPLVIRPLVPTQQYTVSLSSSSPWSYGISGITVLSSNSVSNNAGAASSGDSNTARLPASTAAAGVTSTLSGSTLVIVPSTNAAGQTIGFGTVYIPTSSSVAGGAAVDTHDKESKVSGAVIGGAVAASIVGTLLIVGALVFFLRRRKQAARSSSAPQPFEFDPDMNDSGAFGSHGATMGMGTRGSTMGTSMMRSTTGSSMSPTPSDPLLTPFHSSLGSTAPSTLYGVSVSHNHPGSVLYKTDIHGAPSAKQPQAAAGGNSLAMPFGLGRGAPGAQTSSVTEESSTGDGSFEKPDSRRAQSGRQGPVEIVTETDAGALQPIADEAPRVQYNPPTYDPSWQSRA